MATRLDQVDIRRFSVCVGMTGLMANVISSYHFWHRHEGDMPRILARWRPSRCTTMSSLTCVFNLKSRQQALKANTINGESRSLRLRERHLGGFVAQMFTFVHDNRCNFFCRQNINFLCLWLTVAHYSCDWHIDIIILCSTVPRLTWR